MAMVTDVIKCFEDHLHQKCQLQDYQNKHMLSVCGILLLQPKPNLGRTKLATGPRVGHSWDTQTKPVFLNLYYTFHPFIKQNHQIYPQYTQWCSFVENTKVTNPISLE